MFQLFFGVGIVKPCSHKHSIQYTANGTFLTSSTPKFTGGFQKFTDEKPAVLKIVWHEEIMEACDILPEDIRLWRRQLHHSGFYL